MSDRASNSLRQEALHLLALAAPVVGTQVGLMTLGVVDTMMVGRLGVDAIAAASLGNVWVIGTLIVAMGIVLGIDPVISQGFGANDAEQMGHGLQQGFLLAACASVPVAIAWLYTEPLLIACGQAPELAAAAHRFVLVQLPSIPGFLGFIALRAFLMNRGLMWPALWVVLGANLLNAGLNWLLIYGHAGLPRLGVTGSGLATCLTRIFMFLALAWWIVGRGHSRGAWTGWSRQAIRCAQLRWPLRVGIPVGLQYGLEVWAFQIATLMAGRLGTESLAASTIVLNLASLSFMVPMGISIGAATRVGNLLGAEDRRGAQRSAWVALALGGATMTLFALGFLLLRGWLPALYTAHAATCALAAAALPIAGAFQFFDGIQVVGGAILRGMGRTRPAAVFNLIGYYGVGLPLGGWLAFERAWGLAGVWWGLAAGLLVVAVALVIWIARRGPASVGAAGLPLRHP